MPSLEDMTDPSRLASSGAVVAAGGLGGLLAMRLLESAWRKATGSEVPDDPTDRDVSWGHALAWTVASGIVIGVARLVARRGARVAVKHLADGAPRV